MSGPGRTLCAMSALAGAALAVSLAALVVVIAGPLSVGPLRLGFEDTYDARGAELLAGTPTIEQIAVAEADAHRALALAPYDNTARMRLVYIETLRGGVIGSRGSTLLDQSYELLPFDQNVAAWRIQFALEHWSELSPATRTAVHAEVIAFDKADSVDPPVERILRTVRNPNGRLAAAFWLYELQQK